MSSLRGNHKETNEARDECSERDIFERNFRSQMECSEFWTTAAFKRKKQATGWTTNKRVQYS